MENLSTTLLIPLLIGFVLGGLIGYLALRAGALSRSGAWAAALSGGLIFGLGRIPWSVLLLLFFISSSLLSRLFKQRKIAVSEKFSKGSQRDWGQVIANGGLGAMLVVVHTLFPTQAWPWVAFVGAMAAVNADTWATEIGVLSSSPPRLITSGKIVEQGTSGGVTLLGTSATIMGAFLIGLGAAIFDPLFSSSTGSWVLIFVATLGGLAGSLFDSLLGATSQAIYYCSGCQKETERYPLHICGTQTNLIRGWDWLNNDLVNFACSLFGALVAVGVWLVL
jgi:uncharacterized protein (TIGR00297 family)